MSRGRTAVEVELASGTDRWAGWLDSVALFLVLVVVGMRPLLSETYYSNLDSATRVVQSAGELTPAATAWLDLGIWAAGIAAAGAALLARRRWQPTGIEIGAAVLVAAATISTFAASNRRLALNASFSWLSALVLVATVANLCRDRLRIGLLLAVLAASGVASTTRCVVQKLDDFPATRQFYEQHKTEMWAKQNVPLDDPQVELYERRMNAAEAGGFFAMSNTEASWLSLAGFALLGLRGLVARDRWLPWLLLAAAALVFGAMSLTGSRGAILATIVGVLIWLVLIRVQDRLRHRWYLLLMSAWVGVAGIISFAVIYGVRTGGLPTDSLRFRWNYWQVTREILAHYLPTGVGALNFANAYLAFKPAQFPEEIRDPHNFILAIMAQWGVLGGVGLLAVLGGASYVAARTWGPREPTDAPPPLYDPQAKYVSLAWIVAVCIGFLLLRLSLLSGWLGDTSGTAYVFFDLGLYGLICWIVTFGSLSWLTRSGWTGDIDQCQVACLSAALAFILHNLIDCAMFYPGTLMPFAAMAGLLSASRPTGLSRARSSGGAVKVGVATRGSPLAVLVVGAAVSLALVVVPVTRANALLTRARFEASSTAAKADLYRKATEADPLDPTAPAELARELAVSPDGDLRRAIEAMNEAIARDSERMAGYRQRAELLERSAQQTGSMADLQFALGNARKAVALYPDSPDDHVWLAEMLVRAGLADSPEGLAEVLSHYQRALALDDERRPGEIRRWRPDHRRALQDRMRQLTQQAASRPAAEPASSTSQPTTRAE